MIGVLEAQKIIERKYPSRRIIDGPIVQGKEYVFLTESKSNNGTEDIAGIGRWVDMNTGEVSEKNLLVEISKDAEFLKKITVLFQ